MHIAPKKDVAEFLGIKSIMNPILAEYEWAAYFTAVGSGDPLTKHLVQYHGKSAKDLEGKDAAAFYKPSRLYRMETGLPEKASMMLLLGWSDRSAGQGEILILSRRKDPLNWIPSSLVNRMFDHPIALTPSVEGV